MSDFDGVGWDETKPEREGPNRETAPKGVHNAKIISAEKYKSKAGNWTVKVVFELEDGKYWDHVEYYGLWNQDANARDIATKYFTQLCMAIGMKQHPESVMSLVNKNLQLGIYTVTDSWKDNETGEERSTEKTRISEYLTDANMPSPKVSMATKKSPPSL
jgi:hypothetical protein|tara:strand:- start:353 stop:832 length:480 start_codon:yes stop_codon:yes gene_type:complete